MNCVHFKLENNGYLQIVAYEVYILYQKHILVSLTTNAMIRHNQQIVV